MKEAEKVLTFDMHGLSLFEAKIPLLFIKDVGVFSESLTETHEKLNGLF